MWLIKGEFRMKKNIVSFLVLSLMFNTLTFNSNATNNIQKDNSKPKNRIESYDKRVLFLGNSYTFYNDLPNMFRQLSASGGYNVLADSVTKSGGSLIYFSDKESNLELTKSKVAAIFNEKLKSKWDYVVLQEQSSIPAIPEERDNEMYPMVRELNEKITNNGAQTMLFMTWGYKDGYKEIGYETFEDMQEALRIGYMGIAEELSLPVSPVGLAFLRAKQEDKNINLWADENSHPTVEGSYLAACVFYAKIFNKNPIGLSYTAELTKKDAKFLQKVAAETVLKDKK